MLYFRDNCLWRYQNLPGTIGVILDLAAVALSDLVGHLLGRYTRFVTGVASDLSARRGALPAWPASRLKGRHERGVRPDGLIDGGGSGRKSEQCSAAWKEFSLAVSKTPHIQILAFEGVTPGGGRRGLAAVHVMPERKGWSRHE